MGKTSLVSYSFVVGTKNLNTCEGFCEGKVR